MQHETPSPPSLALRLVPRRPALGGSVLRSPALRGPAPRGPALPHPGWPGWLPGLLLAGLLAALAIGLADAPSLRAHGIGALTLAILIGVAAGHLLRPDLLAAAGPGIDLARQTLLRLGVMLYGLRMTLAELQLAGLAGLATDLVMVIGTLGLAAWLGPRLLKLPRQPALLIGSGAAICGAAAVLATAPVVRARPVDIGVAIATVVCFGTLAIFVYPMLHTGLATTGWMPGGERAFGFYIGSSVHEVAQVIAAAEAVGPQALDAAVVAKMLRVMLLAPVLVVLALWLATTPAPDQAADAAGPLALARRAIPWFAVGFLAMVAINSTALIPTPILGQARLLSDLLLATAMAALGTTIRAGALRAAGFRPLLLGGLLFLWLVVGGAVVNRVLFGLMPA